MPSKQDIYRSKQDVYRWDRRDRKIRKRVTGMGVSGKSVLLLQEIQLRETQTNDDKVEAHEKKTRPRGGQRE